MLRADAKGVPAVRKGMGQTVRSQEILRRLAIIDEGFAEDQAGLGLGLPASRLLDPKTAALVLVPFAFLGFRPQGTEKALKRFMDWLTGHERQIAAGVALLAGGYMVISGLIRVLS